MGFRAECPGGWLGNRSVDGVTAGWDCGTAGFGWSEPLFECPMPIVRLPGDSELADAPALHACHGEEAAAQVGARRYWSAAWCGGSDELFAGELREEATAAIEDERVVEAHLTVTAPLEGILVSGLVAAAARRRQAAKGAFDSEHRDHA